MTLSLSTLLLSDERMLRAHIAHSSVRPSGPLAAIMTRECAYDSPAVFFYHADTRPHRAVVEDNLTARSLIKESLAILNLISPILLPTYHCANGNRGASISTATGLASVSLTRS